MTDSTNFQIFPSTQNGAALKAIFHINFLQSGENKVRNRPKIYSRSYPALRAMLLRKNVLHVTKTFRKKSGSKKQGRGGVRAVSAPNKAKRETKFDEAGHFVFALSEDSRGGVGALPRQRTNELARFPTTAHWSLSFCDRDPAGNLFYISFFTLLINFNFETHNIMPDDLYLTRARLNTCPLF